MLCYASYVILYSYRVYVLFLLQPVAEGVTIVNNNNNDDNNNNKNKLA